jgi:AraC-like DNA-binding protein
MAPRNVPDAPGAAATAPHFVELGTGHLPVAQRAEFWFEGTGRRMQCRPTQNPRRPPNARVRVLTGERIEFMDYASESFLMTRDRAMCRRDGHDEISVGLVVSPRTGAVQNGLELSLRRGDLYVIDFGRPVSSVLSDHHELAIALPRKLVEQTVGSRMNRLGGRKLSTHGVGGLLASHMRALAALARELSAPQQLIAMRAATDLALATLHDACHAAGSQADGFPEGFYLMARANIDRCCGDAHFGVGELAALMGCSRAQLYRLFHAHGQGIAATIWTSRLQRARHMLCSRRHLHMSIAQIAWDCGFLDASTFSRMFRHRYGMSPRDTRETRMR